LALQETQSKKLWCAMRHRNHVVHAHMEGVHVLWVLGA
jgi:hypothetical protein